MPAFELPEESFAEIAVDLKLYADSGAQAVAAGEIILARAGWAAPGTSDAMAELQKTAVLTGRLYHLFRDLIPHEQEFRDFIAGLAARASADAETTPGRAAG